MSAINIVRAKNHVTMVTDGASWSPHDGTVQAFLSKTETLPHLPAMLATRGPTVASPLYAHMLGLQFNSFDQLVAGIEDVMPAIHQSCLPLFNGLEDVELALAGWSRERGPESYLLRTSQNVFGLGAEQTAAAVASGAYLPPPFKLVPFGAVVWAPMVDIGARQAAGIYGVDPPSMSEAELLDYMIKILQLQRVDLHHPEDGGEPFSIVGGFACATTVDSSGTITQKIFHRWEQDREGERINPGPIGIPTVEVASMSRLRQQMQARRARKAARR